MPRTSKPFSVRSNDGGSAGGQSFSHSSSETSRFDSSSVSATVIPQAGKGANQALSSLQSSRLHRSVGDGVLHPNLGLHYAAATGNFNGVKHALQQGQPTDSVLNGLLPLHAASSGGDEATIKLLLAYGADVNAGRLETRTRSSTANSTTGTEGSTPLHFAAANGHMTAVQLLLNHGANPMAQDKDGLSPETLAMGNGHGSIVALLRKWSEKHGPNELADMAIGVSCVHKADLGGTSSAAARESTPLRAHRSFDQLYTAAASMKASIRNTTRQAVAKMYPNNAMTTSVASSLPVVPPTATTTGKEFTDEESTTPRANATLRPPDSVVSNPSTPPTTGVSQGRAGKRRPSLPSFPDHNFQTQLSSFTSNLATQPNASYGQIKNAESGTWTPNLLQAAGLRGKSIFTNTEEQGEREQTVEVLHSPLHALSPECAPEPVLCSQVSLSSLAYGCQPTPSVELSRSTEPKGSNYASTSTLSGSGADSNVRGQRSPLKPVQTLAHLPARGLHTRECSNLSFPTAAPPSLLGLKMHDDAVPGSERFSSTTDSEGDQHTLRGSSGDHHCRRRSQSTNSASRLHTYKSDAFAVHSCASSAGQEEMYEDGQEYIGPSSDSNVRRYRLRNKSSSSRSSLHHGNLTSDDIMSTFLAHPPSRLMDSTDLMRSPMEQANSPLPSSSSASSGGKTALRNHSQAKPTTSSRRPSTVSSSAATSPAAVRAELEGAVTRAARSASTSTSMASKPSTSSLRSLGGSLTASEHAQAIIRCDEDGNLGVSEDGSSLTLTQMLAAYGEALAEERKTASEAAGNVRKRSSYTSLHNVRNQLPSVSEDGSAGGSVQRYDAVKTGSIRILPSNSKISTSSPSVASRSRTASSASQGNASSASPLMPSRIRKLGSLRTLPDEQSEEDNLTLLKLVPSPSEHRARQVTASHSVECLPLKAVTNTAILDPLRRGDWAGEVRSMSRQGKSNFSALNRSERGETITNRYDNLLDGMFSAQQASDDIPNDDGPSSLNDVLQLPLDDLDTQSVGASVPPLDSPSSQGYERLLRTTTSLSLASEAPSKFQSTLSASRSQSRINLTTPQSPSLAVTLHGSASTSYINEQASSRQHSGLQPSRSYSTLTIPSFRLRKQSSDLSADKEGCKARRKTAAIKAFFSGLKGNASQ